MSARSSSRGRTSGLSRLLGATVIAGLFAIAGCSGAGNQDLFDSDGEPTTDTAPINPAPSSSGSVTPPGSVVPPTAAGEPKDDAPPAPPTPPAAKCTPEVEPNNDTTKATLFTTGLCGKISASTDVDYGRFMVPLGKTKVTFKHSETNGKATYKFFAGTLAVQTDGDTFKVIGGMTYSVQIKPNGAGNQPTYELDIEFQ